MGIKPWHIIVLVVVILVLFGAILVLFGAKRLLDKLLDTPTKASARSKTADLADVSQESAPRGSGDPVDTGEAARGAPPAKEDAPASGSAARKTSGKGASAKTPQARSDS
ncbi:MAG: hypothetical protein DLM55_10060 [Acidimicrobiales bacterium]|nr:MAG: hypothetical protein DLM55_10060 [Acidimicrobiales bacterium]